MKARCVTGLNPDIVEVETLPSNAFPEMLLQKCHGYRLNSVRENAKTGTFSSLPYLTDTPSSLPLKILMLQIAWCFFYEPTINILPQHKILNNGLETEKSKSSVLHSLLISMCPWASNFTSLRLL